jgi:hypothetical protein
MTYKCPDCVRNKLSAAMWRNEAYKHAGIELPWSPEEMIEEAVKEEREACAKECEALDDGTYAGGDQPYGIHYARAIRARGQK